MLQLFFSRRWWWTTLLVLAAIGVTIRLGFWQVDRYRQNTAFADHLAAISDRTVYQGSTVSFTASSLHSAQRQ